MSFISDLLEKPASLSIASKYTAMNGLLYLAIGGVLILWPAIVQTVFMDADFVGHERALFRVIGLTVIVIGWFYLFGGRSGAKQFVAASVIDRIVFVPALLVPMAMHGIFPHVMYTLAVLDPALAVGALILRNRQA